MVIIWVNDVGKAINFGQLFIKKHELGQKSWF
jgi:hypothetical protein